MLDLGDVEIHWLRGGRCRQDGGAMFGPVPKVLWNRKYPCDEDNRIPMVTDPLLLRTPQGAVVIDAGLGTRLSDKQRRNFRVEEDPPLLEELAAAGVQPTDVRLWILTHLDWDHVAGASRRAPRGRRGREEGLEPVLPEAEFVVQAREWEAALRPDTRGKAGYWPENLVALAGRTRLVDGDEEVWPGIWVHLSGGHRRGHQVVRVQGSRATALHLADLLPTHAHLRPLWVMGFDDFPLDSVAQKERWLAKAREGNWWLTFYHDPFLRAGRFSEDGEALETVPGREPFPPRGGKG